MTDRMRASGNEAKGTSGESYVTAKLEELGCGVVRDSDHDLGTDLVVSMRDEERYDTGGYIGVQVKNWPRLMDNLSINNDDEGWWFSDSAKHFNHWLNSSFPHLLVLFDAGSKNSYWVHITEDAVQSTGKRRRGGRYLFPRKIFLMKDLWLL